MENIGQDQKAREHALRRLCGASEEVKANMKLYNEKQDDWHTVCPKCKVRLDGTLAELRDHSCNG